jgi:PTH1 family peptidyl-tRNA hydrolase
MLLLVGLGNSGPRYAKNRHNVGFMAVDAVCKRHSFGPFRKRFHGAVSQGTVAGVKVVALKPLTFMNRSGIAVAAAARFYKVPLERIIVVHDEVDLKPGKVRAKRDGGAAGHKGLISIDSQLGNDYWRVRVGVGRPARGGDVTAYVLRDFTKADRSWRDKTLAAIAEALPLLIAGDAPGFMTRVALVSQPPKPRAAKAEKAAEAGGEASAEASGEDQGGKRPDQD